LKNVEEIQIIYPKIQFILILDFNINISNKDLIFKKSKKLIEAQKIGRILTVKFNFKYPFIDL